MGDRDNADEDTAVGRFYDRLIQFPHEDDPAPLLDEALALMIEQAGASLGYIELRSEDGNVRFALGRAPSDNVVDRSSLSSGILDRVISTGETYYGNAMRDEQFKDNGSVRANQIENVLVVPVEANVGAIYLQAPHGHDIKPLIRRRSENFARQLKPLTGRLTGDRGLDAGREAFERQHVVEVLERTGWNVTAAARELGYSRTGLYRLLHRLGLERK